jgi:nicotinamide-nucleotide amidase
VDQELYALSKRVGEALLAKQQKVVTAESCTGGWIAKCITDVAGSSEWFDCGFVTYTNEAKQQVLNVPEQVLADYGAVSEQVVKEMVLGALEASNATIAVSISGIAGPDGGSDGKPVGMVWLAWQTKDEEAVAGLFKFKGDREEVRRQAVIVALLGLLNTKHSSSPASGSGRPDDLAEALCSWGYT